MYKFLPQIVYNGVKKIYLVHDKEYLVVTVTMLTNFRSL